MQPQEDDILDASKVVARRRAEAKALKVSRSERRKEKLALKQQCRVYPTIKGETPDEDAREKKLARLATRGVVHLFNAVRAAQKAEEGADVGKARAAKQGLVRSLEGTAVAPKVRSKAGGGGGAATSSKWGVLSGAGVVFTNKKSSSGSGSRSIPPDVHRRGPSINQREISTSKIFIFS